MPFKLSPASGEFLLQSRVPVLAGHISGDLGSPLAWEIPEGDGSRELNNGDKIF